MNRREVFKAFVAGAVSLLGARGLLERKPQFIGSATLHAPEPVMGEQAHWSLGDTDRLLESMAHGHPKSIRVAQGRIAAAKIDGEWVDTSDWSPEKVRRLCQPQSLKRRQT